ncbi:ArnT family glycosyltransferase [Amycolatopsis minnesotensis]|uniref:Glycosyltransferase family 39 protein n=1 Tax=Amycolatopsis minnesotensis TaxID=337894 RepID=A0ABN2SRJ1_9PSEU
MRSDSPAPEPAASLTPIAWRPVLAITAALAVVLVAVSGQYGYFVDELYFLVAGDHFSWGYADQPWLAPALAHLMDTVAPGSVAVLRVPALIATAAGTVLTAALARELGGGRRAQTLAAAVHAGSFGTLFAGHLLATSTLDAPLWTGTVLLLVRWIRYDRASLTGWRRDRLLLGAAVLTAISLQIKYLVPILWVAIVLALLVFGPRKPLTRPLLWGGLALAAASAVPSLVWQAANGWPQFAMTSVITAENGGNGGRAMFLPLALFWAGALSGAALAVYGVVAALRRAEYRPYRFLGIAPVLVLLAFTVTAGRPYYAAEVFAPLWAISAVAVTAAAPAKWWRWTFSKPVLVLSAVFAIVAALPVLPKDTVSPTDQFLTKPGTTGWPELADGVAVISSRLAPDTAIITGFYPQAAALERYRNGRFTQPVYSGSRGYWFLGTPSPDTRSVLFVGPVPESLRAAFTTSEPIGGYDNPHGIPVVNGPLQFTLLSGRNRPMDQIWDGLRQLRPA